MMPNATRPRYRLAAIYATASAVAMGLTAQPEDTRIDGTTDAKRAGGACDAPAPAAPSKEVTTL